MDEQWEARYNHQALMDLVPGILCCIPIIYELMKVALYSTLFSWVLVLGQLLQLLTLA